MSVSASASRKTTSTLIRNARLVPVISEAPTSSPIDIRIAAGRVVEAVAGLSPGPDDLVVDAAGRWAIPGLWDQHVHMTQWAHTRLRVNLSGTSSPAEVVRRVADHVTQLPAAQTSSLVFGSGYRLATWPMQPTVAALDEVSGAHPVILISGDAHNGWLNSRALQLLGVAARESVLDETEWFGVFPRIAELQGAQDGLEEAYRQAVLDAAAQGVVGIVDLELGAGYSDWPDRFARGIDQLRARTAIYPERLEEMIAAGLRTGHHLPGGGGLLTMGPLKIISDGSLNTRTANCFEPYAGGATLEFPHGKQNYSLAELTALMGRAQQAGLQIALHAIGDAAVATGLDAFSATHATGSIEHAQLVRSEDIQRLAKLGIHASVQPAHLLDDRDVTAHCWPDRADRCFPFQSMIRAGVTLALGSDAPVAPLDPWLAMAAAVHRSVDEREPWNPAEALTAAQALDASTDGQPTIGPGGRGDVVLLDDDPLRDVGDSAAIAAHLKQTRVAATFLAGRPTHLNV
jgi:predicted amidohydrolase YtcJ